MPPQNFEWKEEGRLRTVQWDACLLLIARQSTLVLTLELFLIFLPMYPMTPAVPYFFFYYLSVNPSDDFTDYTDETITGYSGCLSEFLLMFVETLPTAKCETHGRMRRRGSLQCGNVLNYSRGNATGETHLLICMCLHAWSLLLPCDWNLGLVHRGLVAAQCPWTGSEERFPIKKRNIELKKRS